MKECTWCGKEHDDAATVCVVDGEPLKTVSPVPVLQQEPVAAKIGSSDSKESVLFPRHIGRVSFVVRYLLFMAALWVGVMPLAFGSGMQPGIASIGVLALAPVILLAALVYFIRYVVLARLRDVGLNGFFALLVFVPVANIAFLLVLAFVPRNAFAKQHSHDALLTRLSTSSR
jgi:uncharacterized membrane protein YhaH (DUF805 family)